jgi:hypothetical protein
VEKKDYFINNVVMNYPKDKLVECDAVGFGAVLIKRWVLDKIGKKPFMSTCGTGEDILFCYKAKKIGANTGSNDGMDRQGDYSNLSHDSTSIGLMTTEQLRALRKQK